MYLMDFLNKHKLKIVPDNNSIELIEFYTQNYNLIRYDSIENLKSNFEQSNVLIILDRFMFIAKKLEKGKYNKASPLKKIDLPNNIKISIETRMKCKLKEL